MSPRADPSHPCLGTWRIVASSSRFLPVGAILQLPAAHRAEVSWPDADPASSLQLFDQGQPSGERLIARFQRQDPHTGQELSCFFSMVRQPGAQQGRERDAVYGALTVERGRGDSSTGTFVAEETDPKDL